MADDTRPPIWLRPERGARGPRPTHSRADITVAAVRLADAEGIEAVSLRKVAAELGTGTTTLYRYIDTKDELFDLMIDSTFGERKPPTPTGDWQTDLRTIANEYRAILLRHPWLAAVPTTRHPLGPNSLAWLDAAYATVDVLDLDADEVMAKVGTVLTFVRGHAMEELTEQETARRSGVDMAAWLKAQAQHGEMIIGSGNYPHLSRIMVEAETPHAEDRFERAFRRGLDHILTGLAAIE